MRHLIETRKAVSIAAVLLAAATALASCGAAEQSSSGQTVRGQSERTGTSAVSSGSEAVNVSGTSSGVRASSSGGGADVRNLTGILTGYGTDFYYDDAAQKVTAEMQYPKIRLSDEDRAAHPELQEALDTLMEERQARVTDQYQVALDSAKSAAGTSADGAAPSWYVREQIHVRRADDRVVSLILDGESCTEGSERNLYRDGAVFDTAFGNRLALADVLADESLLPDLVGEQLKSDGDPVIAAASLDLGTYFQNHMDTVTWALDDYGLTICFQPEELAPDQTDLCDVTIPFADHPELVKEEYREIPDGYGAEFSLDDPLSFDAEVDGSTDRVTVSADQSADGNVSYYSKLTVTLNGQSFEEEINSDEVVPTLVQTPDGKSWLYIALKSEIFETYDVIDLNGSEPKKAGGTELLRHTTGSDEEESAMAWVLSDPEYFLMDQFTQMLGTAFASAPCHVGADGMPVQDQSWFDVTNRSMNYTVLKKLTCRLVGEDGTDAGTVDLQPGDTVTYLRTDGENWSDVQRSDGTIARLYLTRDDSGNQTVDGTDVTDLFDGILFSS